MLLAFAEFERDMIVERTQAGKEAAKSKDPDWRAGRKMICVDERLFSELRKRNERHEITVKECCRELGISERTWYNRAKTA